MLAPWVKYNEKKSLAVKKVRQSWEFVYSNHSDFGKVPGESYFFYFCSFNSGKILARLVALLSVCEPTIG